MAKVLLINPSYLRTYGSSKASIASPVYPTLGLATIAAVARQRGHSVRLLELCYRDYDPALVRSELLREKPDVVGITATTPLMNQLRDISCLAKEVSKDIVVVGGGAHPSSLPAETLLESMLDFVVYGEGDYTFSDILDGKRPEDIPGVCYRKNGEALMNGPRPLVEDLDDLPFPAWDLYPAEEYRHRVSRLIVRRPPAGMIEFSRGCVFQCDFCGSKNTMGFGYRKKSPKRCAEEMKALKKLGYNEAILADDIFTSDNRWAQEVCSEFLRQDVGMLWTCTNGIRVDSARSELFGTMRKAGCYRVHFGFESGNDSVLKAFGKGGRATLEQGREAVRRAREAGMDTFGMFMFGLSADTEETMQDTIDYGRSTPVDMMRFGITVPIPGTKMFGDLRRAGKIHTYDWDLYNVYNTRPIYTHPNLSWETIERFYKKAFLEAYWMNPAFMIRRLLRGFRTGEFFWDLYYAAKFFLTPDSNSGVSSGYALKDRWPRYDFRPDNAREIALLRPKNKGSQPQEVPSA